MIPVALRTDRLVLDQPAERDIPRITEYCQDPLFERNLTTPWPYTAQHARHFVAALVPSGWADDREYTWAIREAEGGPLIGVVGNGVTPGGVGYLLGTPHRGKGYMTEAVRVVLDQAFARGADRIHWECVLGNVASAAVARKNGFRYTGEGPVAAWRDAARANAWHAELSAADDRADKGGWPA